MNKDFFHIGIFTGLVLAVIIWFIIKAIIALVPCLQ